MTNHSARDIETDIAWALATDFADIQEAHGGRREQRADVRQEPGDQRLSFTYQHSTLKYRTLITPLGATRLTAR